MSSHDRICSKDRDLTCLYGKFEEGEDQHIVNSHRVSVLGRAQSSTQK